MLHDNARSESRFARLDQKNSCSIHTSLRGGLTIRKRCVIFLLVSASPGLHCPFPESHLPALGLGPKTTFSSFAAFHQTP